MWTSVERRITAALGEPVRRVERLGRSRPQRVTWAAEAEGLGALVVKARYGDRADEKTRWCAVHLPLLGARGYPVPEIVWHGVVEDKWHATVERRLLGAPVTSLDPMLIDALITLVELQADAGIEAGERDFAAYQSLVLFDGWDRVWRDAERVTPALCERLRAWPRPSWGLRLPATDFAHNDLNLSNVLMVGATITGVVDWDEFGLNSRAADLATLLTECARLGADAELDRLLGRIVELAGENGLRCLVAYRMLGHLAAAARRHEREDIHGTAAVAGVLLERLGG